MKRVADKRAARNAAVEDGWRTTLRAIGHCEWCLGECGKLDPHEVARGQFKEAALDAPFASILLGRGCHNVIHRMAGDDAICIGLAIIRERRPENYSVADYYALTGRDWPDESYIALWHRRLFGAKVPKRLCCGD